MTVMVDKDKLMDLGFKENQARTIIRCAKFNLVTQGDQLYNNKRLGCVPSYAVEEIIGVPISEDIKGAQNE